MSQYEKTRRAAALKYSQNTPHSAPVVVASGLGYVAQKIIDVAEDNSVPVYQDDSLASLLSQLNAGSEIPVELYQSIVDLYVYFLKFQLNDQPQAGEPALQPQAAPQNQPDDVFHLQEF